MGFLPKRPILGQSIQGWRRWRVVAVAGYMISAKAVDNDQNDTANHSASQKNTWNANALFTVSGKRRDNILVPHFFLLRMLLDFIREPLLETALITHYLKRYNRAHRDACNSWKARRLAPATSLHGHVFTGSHVSIFGSHGVFVLVLCATYRSIRAHRATNSR